MGIICLEKLEVTWRLEVAAHSPFFHTRLAYFPISPRYPYVRNQSDNLPFDR
jgi:hypothetical protein